MKYTSTPYPVGWKKKHQQLLSKPGPAFFWCRLLLQPFHQLRILSLGRHPRWGFSFDGRTSWEHRPVQKGTMSTHWPLFHDQPQGGGKGKSLTSWSKSRSRSNGKRRIYIDFKSSYISSFPSSHLHLPTSITVIFVYFRTSTFWSKRGSNDQEGDHILSWNWCKKCPGVDHFYFTKKSPAVPETTGSAPRNPKCLWRTYDTYKAIQQLHDTNQQNTHVELALLGNLATISARFHPSIVSQRLPLLAYPPWRGDMLSEG